MPPQKTQKLKSSTLSNSQTSQTLSQFVSKPVSIHTQSTSTLQQAEDIAFAEEKIEATGLELQAKYGTITPQGQERLILLQAKMDGLLQGRLENASMYGHNINRIAFRRPDSASPIQAKLTIGQPGDKYEQEADETARQVVQRIHQPPKEQVQREAVTEEEEWQTKPVDNIQRQESSEDKELQMKGMVQRVADGGMAASADVEAGIQRARGGGHSLADSIREPMEQAFGADFSGVRVHTDSLSDKLNQSIQAKAFTTGQDVFFRQGAYEPGSRGGQELLAHELTHVVQQGGGKVMTPLQKDGVIQRLKIKVQVNNNAIKSVSYPNKSRPGGNIRGHQGDHTTAFASFLRMVRNQIMGKDISEVPKILKDLVLNLSGLPGMQIKSADYLHQYIPTLLNDIENINDHKDIEKLLEDIVSFRNQIPLSAYKNSTSTGGHGEGANIAALQECEDRYRNGNPDPRYTPDQMTEWMWDIFDYDPSSNEDTDILINIFCQHIYSMHLTFPNIFDNIAGYDRMFKYLKENAQLMLNDLNSQSRKNVLAGVKNAVEQGPSGLPKIGASKFYNV